MPARPAHASSQENFNEMTGRLEAIVQEVRKKDVSLERSLDLFDEALELGSHAISLVDATDMSPEEVLAQDATSTSVAFDAISTHASTSGDAATDAPQDHSTTPSQAHE